MGRFLNGDDTDMKHSQYSNGHRIEDSCKFVKYWLQRTHKPRETRALEVFGSRGLNQTLWLGPYYDSVVVWEKNPELAIEAMGILQHPPFKVFITDAFDHIWDMHDFHHVLIDHTVGIFGNNGEHCEYFDMFPKAIKAVHPEGGGITINITARPYGHNPEWEKRRMDYYFPLNHNSLPMMQMRRHHEPMIEEAGYEVVDHHIVPRLNTDWGDEMTYSSFTFFIKAK